MNLQNKKYFQEDLNDDDGKKWQMMFSFIINKANFMEFATTFVETGDDLESKIKDGKRHVNNLGFSKDLIEMYTTNIQWQRIYKWDFVIARLSLSSELKKKIYSYKSLHDFIFLNNADIFDPAFYFNNTALLWTVSIGSFVNILLTEKQRNAWIKKGFVLDIDNGISQPTQPSTLSVRVNHL